MNAKNRSELMTKIRDWICKYHNEFDNKGFDWTPNICADVWYEIAKKPVKKADTILCNITIQDQETHDMILILILFRDDDFMVTRHTWPPSGLYDYLYPRIKTFILSHGGAEFSCEGVDLT
jgi:hypothetical protein